MSMNNKKIGTAFEREMCEKLSSMGYWVHFIAPDSRGAQPFDIIAVKDGIAHAIDCKTCVSDTFDISRLEDNQVFAFEKWLRCRNTEPIVVVKHGNDIYPIEYSVLKEKKRIRLSNDTD